MNKMVNVGCPHCSWALFPPRESGQLMTHHSGQISPSRETCTLIEECRQTDTHHLHKI